MGKHEVVTAGKQELQYITQDWVRDALGAKEKISRFYISRDFLLFHLQERRKLCNCRDIKWKKTWEGICVMSGEGRREDVEFKSSFTLEVIKILGHEQSAF